MVHPSLVGYTIVYSREALKFLHKLDKPSARKIFEKIKRLCSSAESLNVKKLKSTKRNLYRLRIGDYRVVYSIDHGKIEIYVVAVGPRKNIYKNIF